MLYKMDCALCFEMNTTQMSKNFDQMSIIGFQFYFVETSKSQCEKMESNDEYCPNTSATCV